MPKATFISFFIVVFGFYTGGVCAGRTITVGPEGGGDALAGIPAAIHDPDCHSIEQAFVPNQIIIKFEKKTAKQIQSELKLKQSHRDVKISTSIDTLNAKYNLKRITPVFPNFFNDVRHIKQLKSKEGKTGLVQKDKRLLRRLNRAPKDAEYPALDDIYLLEVELAENQTLEEAVEDYSRMEGVQYAELNGIVQLCYVPNDAQYSQQWALNKIEAPKAWDITTGCDSIVIAVIDTGVDYRHPDLRDNIWVNEAELNGLPETDDDGNGYVDDFRGWNFANLDNDPYDYPWWEYNGHGTHCAGIIAARGDNELNIAGISWHSKIMPVKVFNPNTGMSHSIYPGPSVYRVAVAMYYAIDNGADILSCSFTNTTSFAFNDVVNYAYSTGVIVVAAAGNNNNSNELWPAASANTISVAATTHTDAKATFSNFGEWIDIAAPGVGILSLMPNSSTAYMSGTSMACPHVSGACALLLSINPGLSFDEIRTILRTTGDPIEEGICGSNARLNLFNAVAAAAPAAGIVKLNRDRYSDSDIIEVSLYDSHLYGHGTAVVTLSTSNDSETLILNEIHSSGAFRGTLLTSGDAPVNGDGVLQVIHGDEVVVLYSDEDDGTGASAMAAAAAWVDCIAPVVTALDTAVPGPEPTVIISTNEATRATVHYGSQCSGPYEMTAVSQSLKTSHSLTLSDVLPATDYFYSVEIADAAGNITIDDNNGFGHSFLTTSPGDIFVPTDTNTIQEAVDRSWDGGTVWLADGVYTGFGNRDICLRGKAITIRSMNGPDDCVIDCQGTGTLPHRAFKISMGETLDTTLIGVTIINGKYYPLSLGGFARGGAILCRNASGITIRDCVFSNNSAHAGGAVGIEYGSQARIDNSTFYNNSAHQFGAAINNSDSKGLVVTKSIFEGNTGAAGIQSTSFYIGHPNLKVNECKFINNSKGAINISNSTQPEISESLFINNYGGPAIECSNRGSFKEMLVFHCAFINNSNTSSNQGGAIYASKAKISNSLFEGNSVPVSGGSGGAVLVNESLDVELSTFVNNSSHRGSSIGSPSGWSLPVSLRISSSIIRDGQEFLDVSPLTSVDISYSNIEGGYAGEGNIGADPLFVDGAGGNFRLSRGSPCIDAGHNAAAAEGVTTDLNGWARFIDDPCTDDTGVGTGAIVDMGAYEFLPADIDGSGRVDLSDYAALAEHWERSGGDCAGADLNCDGAVDLSDLALLAGWWLAGGGI